MARSANNVYTDAMVSGFSPVLQRSNLAYNGSFRVNQRGWSNWDPVYPGAVPCDCWVVADHTTDTQIRHYPQGYLRCQIRGSRRQYVNFGSSSVAKEGFGIPIRAATAVGDSDKGYFTAAVNVGVENGNAPPIRVTVRPRTYSGYSDEYLYRPIIRPGTWDRAVAIVKTDPEDINSSAQIQIELMGDTTNSGCLIRISNFMELAGQFRNPPDYAPVPYAEELSRCMRYYQSGGFDYIGKWAQWNTNANYLRRTLKFSVPMAATPTIAFPGANVYWEFSGGGTLQAMQGSGSITAINVTQNGFTWYFNKTGANNRLHAYGGHINSQQWTASIS